MNDVTGIVEDVRRLKVKTKFGEKDKMILKAGGLEYGMLKNSGNIMQFDSLKPGMKVKICYEQSGDYLNVKNIEVLDGVVVEDSPMLAGNYREERVARMQACYEDALNSISLALGVDFVNDFNKLNFEAVYKTALSF